MDIFYFYLNLAGAMLNMVIGFLNIGTSEMLLIVFVALLLFGGKKLPELARGLGRGIREFKDASETIKRDITQQINDFEQDLEVKDLLVEDEKSTPDRPAESSEPAEKPVERPADKPEPANESGAVRDSTIPAALQSGPPAGTYQHNRGREPDYVGSQDVYYNERPEVSDEAPVDPAAERPTPEADTKK